MFAARGRGRSCLGRPTAVGGSLAALALVTALVVVRARGSGPDAAEAIHVAASGAAAAGMSAQAVRTHARAILESLGAAEIVSSLDHARLQQRLCDRLVSAGAARTAEQRSALAEQVRCGMEPHAALVRELAEGGVEACLREQIQGLSRSVDEREFLSMNQVRMRMPQPCAPSCSSWWCLRKIVNHCTAPTHSDSSLWFCYIQNARRKDRWQNSRVDAAVIHNLS